LTEENRLNISREHRLEHDRKLSTAIAILLQLLLIVSFLHLSVNGSNENLTQVAVGNGPYGIVYNPSNGNLYVANFEPGTVSVISGRNNSVLANVNLGFPRSPWDAAYDPYNGYVYISDTYDGYVSVINPLTNIVVKNVSVGPDESHEIGITYNAYNHEMYVEVFATNSLIAINSTTNSIVDNISLVSIGLPWNIVYNQVNKNLYLTNLNANSVTVINGTNDKIVATIPVGQSPNDLAVDTAQGVNYGNVFVTNYASDSISVISGTTNTVLANISAPTPKGIVFDQNSSNLLVANYVAGTVSVISGTNDSVLGTMPVGREPGSLAYDPSNGNLYVTNFGDSSVTIVPANNLNLTPLVTATLTTTSTISTIPTITKLFPPNSPVNFTETSSTSESLTTNQITNSTSILTAYQSTSAAKMQGTNILYPVIVSVTVLLIVAGAFLVRRSRKISS